MSGQPALRTVCAAISPGDDESGTHYGVNLGGDPLRPLHDLRELWQRTVDRPLRRAKIVAVCATVASFAHLARMGTPGARAGAGLAITLVAAACVGHAVFRRRALRRPEQIISTTMGGLEPDLSERTLRALALLHQTGSDPTSGSLELATLHFERLVRRATADEVLDLAQRVAHRLRWATVAAACVVGLALAAGPFRVVEGLDVLLAHHGSAPMPFDWLDGELLVAHPPDYLRQRDVVFDESRALPEGSLITLRGTPIHPGRKLVVSNGDSEVELVDDAAGGVVARLPLDRSARIQVGARFGAVLIPERHPLNLTAIPDTSPLVSLQGAPRTVRLVDEPDLDLQYEIMDDHGLREIDLVLRSGVHEERRVLSQFDGTVHQDRGGHRLSASDPFFKRTYAPVQVSVEARDNNPLRAPQWGKSESITVVLPEVGQPEARRYQALAKGRDSVVDLSAFRMETEPGSQASARKAHEAREREEWERAASALRESVSGSFAGLRIPRRIQGLVLGQVRRLQELTDQERKSPSAAAHGRSTESAVDASLAIEGSLARLSSNDSAAVAKRLADVADEAAEGALQAHHPSDTERGRARLDAALSVIDAAGGHLSVLGELGMDLGEIVGNDLKRIRRAEELDDWLHTALAARDLAARLRHPSPSFGGGKRAGVESGGTDKGELGEPADGSGEVAREQQEIDDLARDHAAEMAGVERAMKDSASPEDAQAFREEVARHAQAVRQAVRPLPSRGFSPQSAESLASQGREQGESMAAQLESGQAEGAVESGREALRRLEQASRARADPFGNRAEVSAQAQRAHDQLESEVRWAEQALEQQRKRAESRASKELQNSAARESGLAERTKSVTSEAENGRGSLPGPTMGLLKSAEQAMREASQALQQSQGSAAMEKQRQAQRMLEMARSSGEGESAKEGDGQEGEGEAARGKNGIDGKSPIPGAEEYKGPEDFRRRVLEGLARPSDPRMREVVKRYAEGLLR